MDENLIEAHNVGRQIDGRWLLRDVNLTIAAGQRLALVGPSGSGKTLLLRCLALLDPLDAGQICWRGAPIVDGSVPGYRSHAIYLHQRPAIFPGTVEDNLRHPFTLHVHAQRQFDRRRIVQLLAAVERSEDFLRQPAEELSGGEAQLVALLRAVQLEPDVLLLDEPTSALDAAATEMVESLVTEWFHGNDHPRAAVWVTHDQQQARRVSDTLQPLRAGRIIEDN